MNNKRSLIVVALFVIIIILAGYFIKKNVYYGAGGIGNLKMYEFNISSDKLKFAVNETFKKHPELQLPYNAIYKNDNFSTVCYVKFENKEYALGFNYYNDSTFLKENPEKSILVLIQGNYYGKVLLRDGELSESDKTSIIEAFEDKFINKLKEEIGGIAK
jgi:hypothetical protein